MEVRSNDPTLELIPSMTASCMLMGPSFKIVSLLLHVVMPMFLKQRR